MMGFGIVPLSQFLHPLYINLAIAFSLESLDVVLNSGACMILQDVERTNDIIVDAEDADMNG